MKTLNITFEDAEYSVLKMRKDSLGKSWHDFIIWSAAVASQQEIRLDVSNQDKTELPKHVANCYACARNGNCDYSLDYMTGHGDCPIRYKPR